MFESLFVGRKLKKLGFEVKASKTVPMRYEVFRLSNGKLLDLIKKDKEGWHFAGDYGMWFPSPEELALFRVECGSYSTKKRKKLTLAEEKKIVDKILK